MCHLWSFGLPSSKLTGPGICSPDRLIGWTKRYGVVGNARRRILFLYVYDSLERLGTQELGQAIDMLVES